MPAGTLTLTNNSAVVKGTGTAFNTELKAGDFIVSVVGGVTYTLPVKTVDSATQATLIKAYDGPTQAGAAWYAVPRDAMNTITAQLAAETAKALRGLNLDKANWQQVFSGTGNITVTLPDGSTYTGPAWNRITTALNLKADKSDLDKKADKSGGVTLSKGQATSRAALTIDDSWWQTSGGDQYGGQIELKGNSAAPLISYNFLHEKTNEFVAHVIRVKGWNNEDAWYYLRSTGEAFAKAWRNQSDERLKINKVKLEGALDKIVQINGYARYDVKSNLLRPEPVFSPDCGLLAQEVQKVLPAAVDTFTDGYDAQGSPIKNILSMNYAGLSALYVEAIKELLEKLNKLESEINQAIERIDRQDEIIKKLMEKLQ
ncbi:tail fiber domain-containing protein [Serratia nevei]|uniref:tail fiber domain-containing protein n=1 Tax=Serratia nevei TaxID=2703794 RepID=UPI00285DE0AF|nr:tail fiber domain-containing protein [Serratia nevei]MDR8480324.1 tail fiber domain-containing protein [Serratia nevei]